MSPEMPDAGAAQWYREMRGPSLTQNLRHFHAWGAVWARGLFDLQGHRGARGLWPENTLGGFERALALGVSTLELDCAMTRDGVVVVSHDPELNPDHTRDAAGRFLARPGPVICSVDYAELARYDVGRIRPGSAYERAHPQQQALDGERIPRLADLYALLGRAADRDVAAQHRGQDLSAAA